MIKHKCYVIDTHKHTHTPYKQFNVDNSRCYFLDHIGDEVELVAKAA